MSFIGSFISAINGFFSNLICKEPDINKNRIKLVHIGEYCIKAYSLFPKLMIDLISISNIGDSIDDQIRDIERCLFEYYELFENTNPSKTYEFSVVQIPIKEILRKWTYTEYFAKESAN